jgi:predicted protein tyrosine phosphatase
MLTATNISAYEAETIPVLPPNTVMISINREHECPFPLKLDRNSKNILTVKFSDITDIKEDNGIFYKPIDGLTTLQVLDFINLNKEKNFIVHCAVGRSRSAAICLFIHAFYGHKLKDNFWQVSIPNPYVIGQLVKFKFQPTPR